MAWVGGGPDKQGWEQAVQFLQVPDIADFEVGVVAEVGRREGGGWVGGQTQTRKRGCHFCPDKHQAGCQLDVFA